MPPKCAPLWHVLLYLGPKRRRVVKVLEVAEFMNHYILKKLWRQVHHPVIKVEVTPLRAAAPAAAAVFDKNFFVGYANTRCKVC